MQGSQKIGYFIITTAICGVLLFWTLNSLVIHPGFLKLQIADLTERSQRSYVAIKQNSDQLGKILLDWSNWDALYDYVVDQNLKFFSENLRDWKTIQRDLNLNALVIFNDKGKVIYSQGYDSDMGGTIAIHELSDSSFRKSGFLSSCFAKDKRVHGILQTNFGLLMIGANPIMKSNGSGPSRGVILFGRFMNEQFIKNVEQQSSNNLEILYLRKYHFTAQEGEIPSQCSTDKPYIRIENGKPVVAYQLFQDIYDKPAGLVKTSPANKIPELEKDIDIKLYIFIGSIGVAIIILIIYLRNRKFHSEFVASQFHVISIGVTVFVGIIISIGLFYLIRQRKVAEMHNRFESIAALQINEIKQKLGDDLEEIAEITRFMEIKQNVGRADFREFVFPYLSNDAFQAIEWIPKVSDSERESFENAAKKTGSPDFYFSELDSSGKKIRALRRPFYHPVYFVEPFNSNKAAYGYSPVHLQMRNEAIARTEATEAPTITAPFTLIQETGTQKGLMLFAPVLNDLGSKVVRPDPANVRGVIACVYRIDDLLNSVSLPITRELLPIRFIDVTADNETILNSIKPDEILDSTYTSSSDFVFAGRKYRIEILANEMFIHNMNDYLYVYILIGGLLVTIFISLYLSELFSQKSKAEKLVATRTAELQESENRYRAYIAQSAEGIWRMEFVPSISIDTLSENDYSVFFERAIIAECNDVFDVIWKYRLQRI
ncbi:MAG: CHASE domain-containing protein [Ignavibacteria bacterium]|nr:CHASE domain-containing protein [Ignavibacteria bacterium]